MRKLSRGLSACRRGFTLIELLVVCAIIIVVSGILLANNNKLGGQVTLENFAYDVALTLRQAQVYGIAVNRFGTNNFSAGYGIHFQLSNPTTYILFADTEGNGLYDPNASPSEIIQTENISQGFQISDLCSTPASASTENCGLSSLDVLFKRPEPDAYISANGTSAILQPSAIQQQGHIVLLAPKGDKISVKVQATGQISVDQEVTP